MLDIEVTHEVADAIAEIGKHQMLGDLLDANGKFVLFKPRHPNYDSPEGVLFRKALALIKDKNVWVPYAAMQSSVPYNGGKLCSVGALELGFPSDGYFVVWAAVSKGMDQNISKWNDSHTHAEVIAKWHEAGHANGWL